MEKWTKEDGYCIKSYLTVSDIFLSDMKEEEKCVIGDCSSRKLCVVVVDSYGRCRPSFDMPQERLHKSATGLSSRWPSHWKDVTRCHHHQLYRVRAPPIFISSFFPLVIEKSSYQTEKFENSISWILIGAFIDWYIPTKSRLFLGFKYLWEKQLYTGEHLSNHSSFSSISCSLAFWFIWIVLIQKLGSFFSPNSLKWTDPFFFIIWPVDVDGQRGGQETPATLWDWPMMTAEYYRLSGRWIKRRIPVGQFRPKCDWHKIGQIECCCCWPHNAHRKYCTAAESES